MYSMYFMPVWSGLTQSLNLREALWLWRLTVPVGSWGLIQPYNTKESHHNMCAIDTDPNHYIYCSRKMYDSVSSPNELCSQIDSGFHPSADNSSASMSNMKCIESPCFPSPRSNDEHTVFLLTHWKLIEKKPYLNLREVVIISISSLLNGHISVCHRLPLTDTLCLKWAKLPNSGQRV